MIIKADSRHIPFADNSVNCIVTSPPYWALRKYDVPDVIWDGEDGCEHDFTIDVHSGKTGGSGSEKLKRKGSDNFQEWSATSHFCGKCGAWKGQLGLEPTFDLYLKHLLQIMDECWRVLRDDGTLWVNIGDTYSSSGCGAHDCSPGGLAQKIKKVPHKSLILIPERFTIEMVNRGWILRNKIIWHKPNGLPSSVKDRFTVDWEPVYFFVKSKKYWFEQQFEPHSRDWTGCGGNIAGDGIHKRHNGFVDIKIRNVIPNPKGRNKRCVWTVPTAPYPESHFAVYPPALVEPMIKAGCPPKGVVLDPFCGSGTTVMVAEKLGRQGVGIDLNYQDLAKKRLQGVQKVIWGCQ